MIVATFLAIGAYLIFARPKAVPSQVLFEKLFPSGSVVSELETIDLDVDGVLQNPIFRTLREYGPIPITVPPLGKTNPFL
ncbi:MAG: hypothetical protein HYS57_02345 [Parcubacteria group bacterium]|nr:hypothetical protein [Parcubacteria group bacterium]